VRGGAGPVALVGSGEYLPVLEDVERALISGRPGRYVQLATAAAPEGPRSLDRWHRLGADAARRLGVEQVALDVVDRDSADDPASAAQVAGAGLIYLSGGNPAFLTQTLQGTAVWAAIVDAWRGGSALAGCSAGAMALSASVPEIRQPLRDARPGLGVVPMVEVLPHFDRLRSWRAGLVQRRVASAPDGVQVLGIDEDTAVVGGLDGWGETDPAGPGSSWRVLGRGSAWRFGSGLTGGPIEHVTGSTLVLA